MDYEYDAEKSLRYLAERGIDFAFAARLFDTSYVEFDDRRAVYGETRHVATGSIDGNVYVVVYTWRSGRRRIISARRANRRERDAYRRTIT